MFVKKFNENDWQAYKAIRLEALSLHADMYGNSLAFESAWPDQDWQDLLSKEKQAFFGLYDNGALIGCAGVYTDHKDKSGRSAILVGSYIREAYREQRLSHLLYEERINWIIRCGHFDKIIVGHKKGNEPSRRANQAFGFDYVGEEEKEWGDGTRGLLMRYEMRLRA